MDGRRTLEVSYFPDRDLLSIHILPRRSGRPGGKGVLGFLIDRTKEGEIVGFEIWDFSAFIPHLHKPGVVPELTERFAVRKAEPSVDFSDGSVTWQVEKTALRAATLAEVLEWAYREFLLSKIPPKYRPVKAQEKSAAAVLVGAGP